jgi:hypothetical protein
MIGEKVKLPEEGPTELAARRMSVIVAVVDNVPKTFANSLQYLGEQWATESRACRELVPLNLLSGP